MLRELLKERLLAAADEILALFERTVASYEDELSRTREENERLRQQLEALSKTQIVLHVEGVQQLIGRQEERPHQPQGGSPTLKQEDPQLPHVKEEEEQLWVTQECLLGLGEVVKAEDHEDKPLESSQLHHSPSEENKGAEPPSSSSPQHTTTEAEGDHCGGSQAGNLLAPSDHTTSNSPEDEDRDHTQKALSSDADCEDVQQRLGRQKERPHQPQGGSSSSKREYPQPLHIKEEDDPQPPRVKEEAEELWVTQECLPGPEEADLTKLPLTVVSVKTEDHEDKPPESSPIHHSPSEEPPSSSSPPPQHTTTEADGVNRFAPLPDCEAEDTREASSSDTDFEGDTRTRTANKHSECSQKKAGKKRLTCSVCAKSFCDKCDLRRHMRTHTGEKPFACSVCGKRFSDKSNMVKHTRTHTGEKPFTCSVCGDKFVQSSTLNTHMRTHTGEKPFCCSFCGKSFSCKSNMNVHMRTHRVEKPFSCSMYLTEIKNLFHDE
ncbi:oocyte zinc finger protein XlCOF8.4-like [Dunckerocampus dactyliophorus]|uniref:oocyte zinc finger protein XlCOF8.4-like n=1 Tax=Dunckerocampus dactyliophorus TaxID=161453 RepID=UPI00240668D8|nr:oocyte zinc finger protein XlCOF8.4-like [Dunckerocampus dactyliophorus]